MTPQLPQIDAGQYLVDWLFELGPTMPAGMGSGALTFQEIAGWQLAMGLELQAWEVRALRQLSQAYLGESQEATKPTRPPPYGQLQRNPRLADLIDEIL
ncbi:MAG: hypothetical protein PGN26_14600 [Xylophilus ampelinus]